MDRERQARWDAAHLRTASTKLTVAEYRQLQEACAAEGHTVYSLLRWLLQEWLMEYAEAQQTRAAEGWLSLPFRSVHGPRAAPS